MPTNFKQTDPRWAYKPYAGENMAYAGCGPTAVADVLDKSPVEIADWMTAHGYASNGSGTYQSGITACIRAYGKSCEQITPSSQAGSIDNPYFTRFFNTIKQGNCGILLMGGTKTGCKDNYWSKAGHYIAIVGYQDGKYLVYDPAYAARDGWHPFSDFSGDIKHCFITNIKWGSGKGIDVDGNWGCDTTRLAQRIFGTPVDGEVSNQNQDMMEYLPNCMPASWQFVPPNRLAMGSALVRAIQHFLGITADGFFGAQTIKAFQKWLGVSVDGYVGSETVKAFQRWLNSKA